MEKTKQTDEAAIAFYRHVRRSADSEWRKCKWCGRYISFKEMETDAVCEFIPDTHFTFEKTEWMHKHCA